MKARVLFLAFYLGFVSSGFSDSNFEFGGGLEWDGALAKTIEYRPATDGSAQFRLQQRGGATLDNSDFRPSISLMFRTLDMAWIGVRASQGLSSSRGNFASVLSVPFPIPRANAVLKFDLADWVSVGVEFPYNPGLAVQVFGNHYLFAGTDDYTGDPSRNPSHVSLAYLYVWRLK